MDDHNTYNSTTNSRIDDMGSIVVGGPIDSRKLDTMCPLNLKTIGDRNHRGCVRLVRCNNVITYVLPLRTLATRTVCTLFCTARSVGTSGEYFTSTPPFFVQTSRWCLKLFFYLNWICVLWNGLSCVNSKRDRRWIRIFRPLRVQSALDRTFLFNRYKKKNMKINN